MLGRDHETGFRGFLRKHHRATVTVLVIVMIVLPVIFYEVLTTPPSQIPQGRIPSINLKSLGYNKTIYPLELNKSGNGFKVTFELRSGGPAMIPPGYDTLVYFGISIINRTVSSPYSAVGFYIKSANFSIGNYTMSSYATSYTNSGQNSTLWLQFTVTPGIVQYDPEGYNYTGSYRVTIVPVLYFGIFHFVQSPLTINSATPYPWYYIEKSPVT